MATVRSAETQVCGSLTPPEEAAWFGLLHTHSLLTKEIDAELTRAHRLPLTSFEVLIHVHKAGVGGIGMSDLARLVLLSPSGLSRLVDRLEEEGLLARQAGDGDARCVRVAITGQGRQRLHEAAHTHMDVVRKRFLSALSEAEMQQLGEIWRRVAGEGADRCRP